jgi:hypothetical protein
MTQDVGHGVSDKTEPARRKLIVCADALWTPWSVRAATAERTVAWAGGVAWQLPAAEYVDPDALCRDASTVFAKGLDGRTTALSLPGHAATTVATVQALLARRLGIPAARQRLIYGGRQLDDPAAALSEYEIGRGATLHLSLRLPGGIFFETMELLYSGLTYVFRKVRRGWNWAIGSRCCHPTLPCRCAIPPEEDGEESEAESYDDEAGDTESEEELDDYELDEMSVKELRAKGVAMGCSPPKMDEIIAQGNDYDKDGNVQVVEDPKPLLIQMLHEKEEAEKARPRPWRGTAPAPAPVEHRGRVAH